MVTQMHVFTFESNLVDALKTIRHNPAACMTPLRCFATADSTPLSE